jgi:hypothetical protein
MGYESKLLLEKEEYCRVNMNVARPDMFQQVVTSGLLALCMRAMG